MSAERRHSAHHARQYRRLGPSLMVVCLCWATPAPALEDWALDYVVVTIAQDGSWGVAVHPSQGRAIAAAIANCQMMSMRSNDCGATYTVSQGRWSLGFKCGRDRIVVTGRDPADAQAAALNREMVLRDRYVPDMPPCLNELTVDPSGRITTPAVTSHP